MPLVRYEIRNEHSLANPQLYRTAGTDDPEGLLEGVAMAGLVGIVRQLGDLAEFAAEVFRDLHEEVMATASRNHELVVRVQQLEAEMPAVEKALLSETNQLRFAYTPGIEWHASIRNDQNHCTQGDLPRFIRSSYEECRGPPRLFLLDKFDMAGAGACLKRYTDPSFFRTEWASSELMKAERVQRDKRARREKKKGRRRRNADGKESIPVDQYQTRFSHELSKELLQSDNGTARMWHPPAPERPNEALSAQQNINYNENLNALSRHLAAETQGRDAARSRNVASGVDNAQDMSDKHFMNVPEATTSTPSHLPLGEQVAASSTDRDENTIRKSEQRNSGAAAYVDEIDLQATKQEDTVSTDVDDGVSDGEQFLDALTTMESEADTDSEPGFKQERDAYSGKVIDVNEAQSTQQEDLRSPRPSQSPADRKVSAIVEQHSTRSEVDSRVPNPLLRSSSEILSVSQQLSQENLNTREELYQTGSDEKMSLPVEQLPARPHVSPPELYEKPSAESWNGAAAARRDDVLRSPKLHQASSAVKREPEGAQLPSTVILTNLSGPILTQTSGVSISGHDKRSTSPSFATSVHQLNSADSISSSGSRRFKRGKSVEESFDSLASTPKRSVSGNDEKIKKKFERDEVLSSGPAGVKVSKMVAAIERGSLEQIGDDDRERDKEFHGSGRESPPGKSGSHEDSREGTGFAVVTDAQKSDVVPTEDIYGERMASPPSGSSTSINGSYAKSRAAPPKIEVETTSPSNRVSVGSLESPPDSPIFSALHSPMSPVRTGPNILSSPDSHYRSLAFSSELLSPGSPTSVPILALSPTSKKVPPPLSPPSAFPPYQEDHQNHQHHESPSSPSMVEVPFGLSSPSILPTEAPKIQPKEQAVETSPLPVEKQQNIGDDSSTSLRLEVAEDSVSKSSSPTSSSASAASLNDPLPTVVSSHFKTPAWRTRDAFEEFDAGSLDTTDVAHTSNAEEQKPQILATTERADYSDDDAKLSPSSQRTAVETVTSPVSKVDDAHDHQPFKDEVIQAKAAVSPPSSLSSSASPSLSASTSASSSRSLSPSPLPAVRLPGSKPQIFSDEEEDQLPSPSPAVRLHDSEPQASPEEEDDQLPSTRPAVRLHGSKPQTPSDENHDQLPSRSPAVRLLDEEAQMSSSGKGDQLPSVSSAVRLQDSESRISLEEKVGQLPSASPAARSLELESQVSPNERHSDQLSILSKSKRFDEASPKMPLTEAASHESPFPIPTRVISHKRFPSTPPLEKTFQTFSSSPSSSRSLMTARPVLQDSPVPASKFVHDLPSRSPRTGALSDLPFSVPKSSHRRFPSFPSEKFTLQSLSTSSKRLPDFSVTKPAISPKSAAAVVRFPASNPVHNLPTPSASVQVPHPLPFTKTPSSKSKQDGVPPSPPPFRTLHELRPPPPPSRFPPPLSAAAKSPARAVDGSDKLLDAIASHDKSSLKKVKTMENPTVRQSDERAHLMEQIRAQSFNLRHTVVEKVEAPLPRPVTNINVAAILEKANAIRQAFAGSDEDDEDDDDWSDV